MEDIYTACSKKNKEIVEAAIMVNRPMALQSFTGLYRSYEDRAYFGVHNRYYNNMPIGSFQQEQIRETDVVFMNRYPFNQYALDIGYTVGDVKFRFTSAYVTELPEWLSDNIRKHIKLRLEYMYNYNVVVGKIADIRPTLQLPSIIVCLSDGRVIFYSGRNVLKIGETYRFTRGHGEYMFFDTEIAQTHDDTHY